MVGGRRMSHIHGGDVYRNRIQYDYSVNINPLGMPAACKGALEQSIQRLGQYPDVQASELREAIAATEKVQKEAVLVGNGAAELLYAVCQAIRPENAWIPAPSFAEYGQAAMAAGSRVHYWQLEPESFRLDEAFCDVITEQTGIVFLCNPNNPVGNLIRQEVLDSVVRRCEQMGVWLCVDECFLPFLQEEETYTLKRKLAEYPHLMVLRAFTKLYGMPGLRLGYLLTENAELRGRIRQVLQPWNTSLPAQEAGVAALSDGTFIQRTKACIPVERKFLCECLQSTVADRIYEGCANFIFFHAYAELAEELLQQGILIRDCKNYENLQAGYYRIAVKAHADNVVLQQALQHCADRRKREGRI